MVHFLNENVWSYVQNYFPSLNDRSLVCSNKLTIYSQLTDRYVLEMWHVAECWEDDKTCQNTGQGVGDGDSQGVSVGGKKDVMDESIQYAVLCPY